MTDPSKKPSSPKSELGSPPVKKELGRAFSHDVLWSVSPDETPHRHQLVRARTMYEARHRGALLLHEIPSGCHCVLLSEEPAEKVAEPVPKPASPLNGHAKITSKTTSKTGRGKRP